MSSSFDIFKFCPANKFFVHLTACKKLVRLHLSSIFLFAGCNQAQKKPLQTTFYTQVMQTTVQVSLIAHTPSVHSKVGMLDFVLKRRVPGFELSVLLYCRLKGKE